MLHVLEVINIIYVFRSFFFSSFVLRYGKFLDSVFLFKIVHYEVMWKNLKNHGRFENKTKFLFV